MATFKEQEIKAPCSLQGLKKTPNNPVAKMRNESMSFWPLPSPTHSHVDTGEHYFEHSPKTFFISNDYSKK